MKHVIVILLFCGLGICLFVMSQNKSEMESAIINFHAQFNHGKFEDIWNDAQSKFHDTLTIVKFNDYLQGVQNKLGKVKSSNQVSKREINSFSWTRKIEIVQRTVFEKGECNETFAFEFINHKAQLIRYHIK